MKLARVVGTVVSTINAPDLRRPDAPPRATCSTRAARPPAATSSRSTRVGAGAGETVLLLDEGNSARQVLGAPGAPIRTVVVGIVDEVTGAEVSS